MASYTLSSHVRQWSQQRARDFSKTQDCFLVRWRNRHTGYHAATRDEQGELALYWYAQLCADRYWRMFGSAING